MFQTATLLTETRDITFDEFLDWYPDGHGRYELYEGVIAEMQPTGTHEQVGGFTAAKLSVEIDRHSMDRLISIAFPHLALTAAQIFNSSNLGE